MKTNFEKVTTDETDECSTCKYLINGDCDLEGEGCQTDMWERFEAKE